MNFHSAELLKAFKGKHRENVLSQTVNIGLKIADVFIENFKRRTLQFPGSDFQKKEVVQRYNYFKVAANPKLLQRGKKERMLNPTHGKKIKNSNQTFPLKRKKKSIHALKFVQKKNPFRSQTFVKTLAGLPLLLSLLCIFKALAVRAQTIT